MAALEKLTRFWDTSWTPCKFNSDKCLALEEITSSFSAPITEEHAWAIVFECVKCLHSMVERKPRKVFIVNNTKQILLHQEGRVHESTFLIPENCGGDQDQENSVSKSTSSSTSRASTISESKVVQELALVMYAALDIGLKEDEERTLSPGMENLLAHMISAGEGDESHSEKVDTDDEGIEQDHDDFENRGQSPHGGQSQSQHGGQSQSQHGGQSQHNRGQSPHVPSECLRSTLGLCQSHLSVESEAEDHYRNVCRALVMEAMELSFFLEKTYLAQQESEQSEELKLLARKDWANLWISTMNELRNGVKLKKTNHTKTPIEYALTPYEMLMDDIRSRRYKLNKVMVDGSLPAKVKKDAHDIILEFIRSRPPLKPACNRILRPPPRKYSTPQELLMESLKSDEAKNQLKKTSGPPERPSPLKQMYQQHEWTDAETTLLRYEKQAAQQAQNGYSAQNGHPAHHKPKTSFAGYEGSRETYRRPMQRSMSLSNGLQRRNSQRVVIRPDEAFSKFDPENDDDELSDPDLDRTLTPENNNFVNKQLHQVRRNSAATTSATTHISSTSGYPISGSVDRMRPKIIRRSRGSSSAGLGTSLSNLTSVSEAEHLTASAVSYRQTLQDRQDQLSRPPVRRGSTDREQPLTPNIILSTPSGLSGIREEQNSMTSMNSSSNNHCMNYLNTGSSTTNHRRSSSIIIKSRTNHNQDSNPGNNQFAWVRRHSLQAQPQPLSVQGFGHRYNTNPITSRLERATATAASADTNSLRRARLSMLAGRRASASDQSGLEENAGRSAGHYGSAASILSHKKLSSPSYIEAIRNHSNLLHRRGSHVDSYKAEKASPTLALSHSELTHIRSALSRAKLESLAPDLKSEIVKGNICFLCTKTKFNLFFARRHHCQLCQQNVCSKCISKAKLPEDQRFDNVPVFALSPGQSSPHLVKSSNNNKAFIPITTNSSTKVKLRRSNTLNGRYDRPNSVAGDAPGSSPGILSSLTSISSSNSSGLTLNVCLDCKHAVESMTQQTRQQIQPQNNQPQTQPQIQPQHNQNPLPDFEPATFQQRRRFSHQDYMRRRSIVTKSLILD